MADLDTCPRLIHRYGMSHHTPSASVPPELAQASLEADAAYLRYLARQVQDEGQLDAILATIDNLEMREAVREFLRPLLSFPLRVQES